MNTQQNLNVLNTVRKEDKNMSDLELYMRDLSLEVQSTKDMLTAHLGEAARVLSLTTKDIKFNVEGNCKSFTLSVKFDYLNETRYVQFKVTKEQRVWNITYRIYSYDDFLRERTIKTVSVVELQMFMQLVLKQDLYLEIDSNIVE
jgi:hypothetical protein